MRSDAARLVPLAAALACACGGPLVGDGYLGTPALVLSGQVTVQAGVAEPVNARLSLFWLGYDTTSLARSAVEQRTEVETGFPASFSMAVFDAPPGGARPFADPDGGRLGIAFIAVYADLNDNGVMNSDPLEAPAGPDMLIGASSEHLVVYTEQAVTDGSEAAGLLGGPLSPGYHLMRDEAVEASCGYADLLGCAGDSRLVEEPADTPLELTVRGDPRAVVLPKPATFAEALHGLDANGTVAP